MLLTRSRDRAARLELLEECGSTNTELVSRAGDGWPHLSVVVTGSQTAGRGRLGRGWVAPPGRTLAVSVLLRPTFGPDAWGWVPLIAGVAVARAVRSALPTDAAVGVKWPNDVLAGDLKVSGILSEVASAADADSGAALVVGAGINLFMTRDELPTDTSTSLTLEGADADELADRVLSHYLHELTGMTDALHQSGGDAVEAGIRDLVVGECVTIGRRVRVLLPSGEAVAAEATGIDGSGRLLIVRDGSDTTEAVSAGDVTHVRYE